MLTCQVLMSHFKHNLVSGRTQLDPHPATVCCQSSAAIHRAPALAPPQPDYTIQEKERKEKNTSGQR